MASKNKMKVTDAATIEKLIDEYNKHVAAWNEHKEKVRINLSQNKPTEGFKYIGPIEVVILNGRSTRSIGVYLDDTPGILYTIVTRGHSVYLAHSDLKIPLDKKHIANVWQEETKTSFQPPVERLPKMASIYQGCRL